MNYNGLFVDPGEPKRPDPTGSGSGSATLLFSSNNCVNKIHDALLYDETAVWHAPPLANAPNT